MKHTAKSIRAFIGTKNFDESRHFYNDLGFEESIISKSMSYFKVSDMLGFYLQNAYIKDWVDNSMLFLEVDDVDRYWNELQGLGLHQKYASVRLTPIREEIWGKECFMHDPSGILWHFGQFR
ncbi:VOC family protein [Olivibacter sitiensis]|uniref:VOC family protein n=1 Tax=Olivibacter sitiensis TaxID=376470 RepID=UPI00041B833B|nr:VOC family protein [Olivibacter sitiensis]